jgi:hypothetical protein
MLAAARRSLSPPREDELVKHLQPGRVRWWIHYDDRRAQHTGQLTDVQLVATTYETVIDDAKNRRLLC